MSQEIDVSLVFLPRLFRHFPISLARVSSYIISATRFILCYSKQVAYFLEDRNNHVRSSNI